MNGEDLDCSEDQQLAMRITALARKLRGTRVYPPEVSGLSYKPTHARIPRTTFEGSTPVRRASSP
jgi:hypothetical protein